MSGFEIIVAIVTVLIAIYGAGLSTYTHIARSRERRRVLKVSIKEGAVGLGGKLGDWSLIFAISNPGFMPIVLSSIALLLPDGKTVVFFRPQGTANLPHELAPGRQCQFWTGLFDLAVELSHQGYKGLVRLKLRVTDETDCEHLSKGYTLNIEQWSQTKS